MKWRILAAANDCYSHMWHVLVVDCNKLAVAVDIAAGVVVVVGVVVAAAVICLWR